MNYFIDTEFLEGTQEKRFLGIKYGNTKPTIDLISIGIVSENGKEFYAISKEFNLKEAWNRCEIKLGLDGQTRKIEYWIRDNILKPIFNEHTNDYAEFNYKNMKRVINSIGLTKSQIVNSLMTYLDYPWDSMHKTATFDFANTKFYGYFCDYDWVVFCWLWGKMKDLPEGFPYYCIDLKQIMSSLEVKKSQLPIQENEHNALDDAKWNKQVFEFLETYEQL